MTKLEDEKAKLRPIGATFTTKTEQGLSTDSRLIQTTWQVIDHRVCEEYGVKHWAEEVKAIKVEYLDAPIIFKLTDENTRL